MNVQTAGGKATKTSVKLSAAILALVLGAFALTGCGGLGQGKDLLLANIGWDENVAISNLTKVLLEDELDYERVDIDTSEDLDATYQEVASGELDAFQDVWLPNQEALLEQVAGDVEHLDPWFLGETKQGMAVPAYMDVKSIPQLNNTDAEFIFGIEPTSVMQQEVGEEVIPAYGLEQQLVEAPTAGMLAEVDRLYSFMDALELTEEQINDLESVINEEDDPLAGARRWASENREVVRPWIEAARRAQ